MDRKDFLKMMGVGGVVFASRLEGFAAPARAATAAKALMKRTDFHFVQLTDTHWGFKGAPNPDAAGTLPKAIEAVNALPHQPDFIIFTGDLTHMTGDPKERRARMAEFKDLVSKLKVQKIHFIPGEHDAGQDQGEAFREFFGETHYAFDHGGFHFIAIDNVSQPGSKLGEAQLKWLAEDLARLDRDQPIVVFAHRPLFDLYPDWDWTTLDGGDALDLLKPFAHVTVFYGHIHQELHTTTGRIAHHAATSLMFPLPVAGSVPKRVPVPWDPAAPYKGLGFREVDAERQTSFFHAPQSALELDEIPLRKA